MTAAFADTGDLSRRRDNLPFSFHAEVAGDTGELIDNYRLARDRLDQATALLAWSADLRDCMANFDVARRLDHCEVRREVDHFKRVVAAHKRGRRP